MLILGIVLACGPILGLLGTIAGMFQSLHRIETLPAPTPGDLAEGAQLGLVASVIGALAGVVGIPLVWWSCVRLARLRETTP